MHGPHLLGSLLDGGLVERDHLLLLDSRLSLHNVSELLQRLLLVLDLILLIVDLER